MCIIFANITVLKTYVYYCYFQTFKELNFIFLSAFCERDAKVKTLFWTTKHLFNFLINKKKFLINLTKQLWLIKWHSNNFSFKNCYLRFRKKHPFLFGSAKVKVESLTTKYLNTYLIKNEKRFLLLVLKRATLFVKADGKDMVIFWVDNYFIKTILFTFYAYSICNHFKMHAITTLLFTVQVKLLFKWVSSTRQTTKCVTIYKLNHRLVAVY